MPVLAITRIGKYYRTTVPREVRRILELRENDEIEWILEGDKIIVSKRVKVMVKHAILLASEEWCRAVSTGRIKVYDFIKPRRRGIHALAPGSICVVLTRAMPDKPSIVYGEFTVREVREVDVDEYNRLVSEGLIYNPQTLRPGERRWIIVFDEFREYRRKIPRRELTDVRTSTSRKPVSEWVIRGLSYIDDQALEGIRRRTSGFVERRGE